MAARTIKPWNIYVKGTKVATGTSYESTIDAPGELQIAAEGVIGRAQGVATSKITLNTIITYDGEVSTQLLIRALLNNEQLTLTQGVVDGKIREYKMWCHSEKLSSDFATGKATGTYDFEGGKPTFTG